MKTAKVRAAELGVTPRTIRKADQGKRAALERIRKAEGK